MLHQELKTAFLQGDESQASELFNEMLRTSVRLGLFAAMEEEINSLCGAKYFPDPESNFQRAGSEIGSAYINGQKEQIHRPQAPTHASPAAEASACHGLRRQIVRAWSEPTKSSGRFKVRHAPSKNLMSSTLSKAPIHSPTLSIIRGSHLPNRSLFTSYLLEKIMRNPQQMS